MNKQTLSVSVAEAASKDMGRAFARIDPTNIAELGASIGDIVAIKGKRLSYGRLMVIHPGERGQEKVQLDGICRSNIGCGVGDIVELVKVESTTARHLLVSPVTLTPNDSDAAFICSQLDGLPVCSGDLVRIMLFGGSGMDLHIENTEPAGPVVIGTDTEVQFQKVKKDKTPHNLASSAPAYEDIGGLGKQLGRIREMIEMPIKYPQIFDRLGIDPPRGVLLHGPPGCGKTLIAKAIAHEAAATFFAINGPEIVHKFYGESEAHLRRIFDKADKNGPAIIFLDEIDAIAPRREKAAGDVERRIVAQLLTLMDGLKSRSQLVVIGATNLPQAIDPALRRPGRFDREIVIPVPDRHGRKEILEIHSRGMPLHEDINLVDLAESTHGFVGADLAALCREAAMCSLRRFIPLVDLSTQIFPYDKLAGLKVCMDDFTKASTEVEPSAVRELFAEVPEVRWEDVGGLDYAKNRLVETVEWPLHYPHLFEKTATRPTKGILLSGPPGCGKTLLARAIATESKVNFISIKGPALLSKYVGESEEAVRDLFKKARQAAPAIIFFDEIDALVTTRSDSSSTNPVGERVLSQFLTEMDGIEELRTVLILAATNRADKLDPAILRPGRFDEVIEITLPDTEERTAVFKVHLAKRSVHGTVDYQQLAGLSKGFSCAEIAGVCNQAAMVSLRRAVNKAKDLKRIEGEDIPIEVSLLSSDIVLAIENMAKVKSNQDRKRDN